MPTQKAIVDELVHCGLWPDDTPEWLEERMPTLGVGDNVIIRITASNDQ